VITRMTVAAVALGVAALAFVGIGSFAGFTGQDTLNSTISGGTFDLQAVPGTPSMTYTNGQYPNQTTALSAGTLTAVNSGNKGDGTATTTLTYTLPNADPGHTYTIPFTVYDTGSLPGEVNSFTYSPGPNKGMLSDFTIQVEFSNNGKWYPIYTPNVPGQTDMLNGADKYSLTNDASGDSGLTNFLGSNPGEGSTATGGGAASQQYEIVETFNASNNDAEGQTATQSFTINGISQ
jgi:hypothetical protein